ncbi:MAG: hypothetical protein ACRENP_14190 [Longimicrobiales bacterium]
MTSSHWFRLAVLPLLLYVALQPVLAVDVAAMLIGQWSLQEQGNVLLLLFFELTRGLRSLIGLALVALLLSRPTVSRAARALALFLLFGEMAYAMAFSSTGYAGPVQEWLTGLLLEAGMSRRALVIAFGYPDWALWLALAALLRFAVQFPTRLTVTDVEASGRHDRSGLMRQVPGAGIDIGMLFRHLAQNALRSGWLEPVAVWVAAWAAAILSVLLRGMPWKNLLWLPFVLGVAIAITCLRASYLNGDADARRSLLWITRGALAACVLFALAGLAGTAPGPAAEIITFVLLTCAPAALLIGLGLAVLQRTKSENVVLVGR